MVAKILIREIKNLELENLIQYEGDTSLSKFRKACDEFGVFDGI